MAKPYSFEPRREELVFPWLCWQCK